MTTTTYTIDLNFQPLHTASDILNTLCFETVMAIEEQNLSTAYCNMFIPMGRKTVFAEVQMDAITRQPIYFVTSSKNQAVEIQSLSYRQAASKLQLLLA